MARKKKIEEEIKEAEVKANEIEAEVDTNEINEEAETLKDVSFLIWDKEYKVSYLIELLDKDDKNYFEVELTKYFKLLLKNYYDGMMHAVLRTCCGRKRSMQELKDKLTETDMYKIIDMRCSRNSIRFDKDTIDTIISLVDKYNLDR